MKKAVYILGVIFGICFLIGWSFKLMHWPGAAVILLISVLCGLVFIPLLAVYQYGKDK